MTTKPRGSGRRRSLLRLATIALLLSGAIGMGGVYADAPADGVIDQLDITLDEAPDNGMDVRIKAHVAPDVIDRLKAAGFTSLFAPEAFAKPSGLKGGRGHDAPPPTSDLAPQNIVLGAPTVTTSGALHVSWNLKNQGTAAADNTSTTAVRINQSSVSAAGANLATVATSALGPGTLDVQGADLTVPSTPGTYYVWIVADSTGSVGNQSSAANDAQRSIAFTITTPPPPVTSDLLPQAITLGANSVTASGALHVTWNLKNQDTGAADATSTTAVRINQSTVSAAGSNSTTVATSALGAGASQAQSADLTVPSTPGTYYVWIVADSTGAVTNQSDTANDAQRSSAFTVVASPPPVTSDLLPQAITLGANSVTASGALHVTWNLKNQDTGAADATSTTAVRINQSTVSAAGSNSTTVATSALGAGASQAQSADLTVPSTPGTYYVWIVADSTGAVTNQSDTANDAQRSAAFTVAAPPPPTLSDLTPRNITLGTASVTAGGTLHVTWNILNQGSAAANTASTVAVRINQSTTSAAGSTLASVATLALGAGVTQSQSADLTVPGVAGTYYVWIVADSGGTVTNQSDTSNDAQRSTAFTITASPPPTTSDLLPQAVTLGANSVTASGALHVTWNLKNQGTGAADNTSTTAVRINQSTVSAAGSTLTTVPTPALAAGATQAQSADVTVPSSLGTYYVWIIADSTGSVTNQSSTANDSTRSGAFTVVATPPPPPPPDASNTMTIANRSGATQTNHPLQFGRPFVCGEIAHFPQVLINGSPAVTQADVKNRCQDGSVKYAILALIVPSVPSAGTVTLTFQDQVSGNNAALSKVDMLDASYNFDATMSLAFSSGANASASARTMLNAGDYKLWTSGGIAQTVEIADDTAARKYDLGNGDGFHPFRPRFYATFWPGLHKVYVRYVGENGLSTELEDLRYALTLTLGNTSPSTVYAIDLTGGATNNKLHWFTTSWTKHFWLGGAPERKININHNLSYLAATKYLPNFDTSLVMPEATIASQYSAWTGKANDLYDGAWNGKSIWQSSMGVPGARGEIAPYPQWTVNWIYTGDWRMAEYALGMADLAAAFPANVREGNTTKRLSRNDALGSGTGLGHVMSITDRRTIVLARQDLYNFASTAPSDRATIVGPFTQKWSYNQAHEPSAFYPQYVLTGEPWYLNEMYMWVGMGATQCNGTTPTASGGRGPTGAEGVLCLQLRGQGWAIRNRAESALAAPDGAPEKAWITTLISDAIARWEGGLGITGTPLDGDPSKVWGALRGNYFTDNHGPFARQPPTLHNWEANGNPTVTNASVQNNESQGIFQVGTVGNFTSPWMLMYDLYGFGRTQELGFPIAAVMTYTTKWFTDTILHSTEPRLLRVYQIPVERRGGGFMSFNDILTTGLTSTYLTTRLPVDFTSELKPDGRTFWAAPGMALAVDFGINEASAAYTWYRANIYDHIPGLASNPKWAIVPRQ